MSLRTRPARQRRSPLPSPGSAAAGAPSRLERDVDPHSRRSPIPSRRGPARLRKFLKAHQQLAEAIEPGVSHLDVPATRQVTVLGAAHFVVWNVHAERIDGGRSPAWRERLPGPAALSATPDPPSASAGRCLPSVVLRWPGAPRGTKEACMPPFQESLMDGAGAAKAAPPQPIRDRFEHGPSHHRLAPSARLASVLVRARPRWTRWHKQVPLASKKRVRHFPGRQAELAPVLSPSILLRLPARKPHGTLLTDEI